MLDTDIEGFGPADAKEYVLAFITTLKTTQKQLQKILDDLTLWTRRVTLAQDRGEAELATQAQARVTELEAKRTQLEGEVQELTGKVNMLREKLVRLRAKMMRTVDTDLLLAQLQMAVGDTFSLKQSFKDEEAKASLEELKKKMAEGGTGKS